MTASQLPSSRYVVGLDLGTTNCAVAYVDTQEQPRRIHTFFIPQIVAPGQIEARDTLPSFHYQPAIGEFPEGSTVLPWPTGHGPLGIKGLQSASPIVGTGTAIRSEVGLTEVDPRESSRHLVGHFARDHGTFVPGRMVASAKSWLCHAGVDRTAELLPWQGAAEVEKLSPVTVSARYLQHAREAWNAHFPEHPLVDQDFVLTLPASFDEVARELTVKAAKQAGLTRIVLIEEPQAAFYAWIDKHAGNWSDLVSPGQKILVCDVGGGTTDLTLIRVARANDAAVQFHRVAVGDHLILGGDNCDLALAHHIEKRLQGDGRLEPRQWSLLVRSCRQLKEVLMSDNAPDKWTLTLPRGGSKVIGGSLQVSVTRAEVRELLVSGFFPEVALDAKPFTSQSGLQEFGLPYAADPSVTTHLAAFLTSHRYVALDEQQGRSDCDPARPDIVLFNGGAFASPLLQRRVVESLERWFRTNTDPHWTPIVLENERLDLAVARGAAYYGMVRRGEGVRIAAGLARTYYIGVEDEMRDGESTLPSQDSDQKVSLRALCLLPAGIEPGHEIDLSSRHFQLRVSQPIEFPLYVSSTRLTDKPGEFVEVNPDQIRALPPIRTVLKQGKSKQAASVTVVLQAKLTEIGTLDLWCREVEGRRSWKLLFDVRSATQTDIVAHNAVGERQGVFDEDVLQAAHAVIASTFVDVDFSATSAPSLRETVGIRGDSSSDHDVLQAETTHQHLSAERKSRNVTGSPELRLSKSGSARTGEAPDGLTKRLVETLGMERGEWPTSLLRQLWEGLIEVEAGRWRSAQHEARWINLTGFALRPGYGLAVDDWRVGETWKLLNGKLLFNTPASRAELSILWRRVAGGLTPGQQKTLSASLLATIRQSLRASSGLTKGNDFGRNPHEAAETLRLLGSCELLSLGVKFELGEMLLDMLHRDRFAALSSAALWALSRVGARRLVYGPLNAVLSAEAVVNWLDRLMQFDNSSPLVAFAVMQLARKTGDRYRDIDETVRQSVLIWMDRNHAAKRYHELVREVGTLETDDQSLLFGEALPKGLRIA
ncbi:MAG: Hsp70 family protein [Planctomycetales bacterium]|nr:Hsp70 family protein [Planctomycetales bacterium]